MKNRLYVDLVCPDGLSESLSFNMPKELSEFVKWYTAFSNEAGYKINLSVKSLYQLIRGGI